MIPPLSPVFFLHGVESKHCLALKHGDYFDRFLFKKYCSGFSFAPLCCLNKVRFLFCKRSEKSVCVSPVIWQERSKYNFAFAFLSFSESFGQEGFLAWQPQDCKSSVNPDSGRCNANSLPCSPSTFPLPHQGESGGDSLWPVRFAAPLRRLCRSAAGRHDKLTRVLKSLLR